MSNKEKEKQERLEQIKEGTYVEREDVKKDVEKQRNKFRY